MEPLVEVRPAPTGKDPRLVSLHAQLYLEIGAHRDAHSLLAPLMDPAPAVERPDHARHAGSELGTADGGGSAPDRETAFGPDFGRLDATVTFLESCLVLGHHDHLAAYLPVLERATGMSADLQVRALTVRVRAHCLHGNYAAALDLSKTAGPEILSASRPRSAVGFFLARIQAHARLGDYDGAEALVPPALEYASKGGDPALEGHVRAVLALIVKTRGRLEESQRLLNRAEELHERAGDVRAAIMDHLNRGTVLNRMGRLAEARECYTMAHHRATHAGFAVLALRASEALGRLAARQGETAIARPMLLASWRSARRMGCRQVEYLALRSVAELELGEGRLAHAACASRAFRRLVLAIAPGDTVAADGEILDASIALARGDWGEAERRARAAVAFCAEHGLPWEEAYGLRLLGSALASSCRSRTAADAEPVLGAAVSAFKRARDIFESMGEKLEIEGVDEWLRFLETHSVEAIISEGTGTGSNGAETVSGGSGIVWPSLGAAGRCVDDPTTTGPSSPDPSGSTSSPAVSSPTSGHQAGALQQAARASLRAPAPRPADLGPIWASVGLVTQYAPLVKLLRDAECLAQANISLLVLGETGTGKELVARGIHQCAPGKDKQFVTFNCGTRSSELFDAELFGHVRGAFTGAHADRPGLIRAADGGTLFLDEIGELSLESQAKLLRFLDSGEVRPVGADRVVQARVRLIAATNVPLQDRMERGRFREDLYYRLAGACIALPPLRDRRGDVRLLVEHFTREIRRKRRPDFLGFSERVLRDFEWYAWPGNVRQLSKDVHRVAALWPSGSVVDGWEPPARPGPATTDSDLGRTGTPRPGPDFEADRERLVSELCKASGSVTALARRLKVSRSYLYDVFTRLAIDLKDYRRPRGQ